MTRPERKSPRAGARALAAVASLLVIVAAFAGPIDQVAGARPTRTPAPTPTPAVCNLVPQLRDVAITQGVGAYTPLVRGKEALVRAYLSKPSCAASSAIIELTGGSVTVTPGSAAATTISNPTPRPTAPYPQIAAFAAAPLVSATADPLWVVPGAALAPSNTAAAFSATFSITVQYQSRASSTATAVPGSVTFTTRPGSSTPITAGVGGRTNALRVLVVPMGNASLPFAESYTAAGDAALQAAMLTMSRIYPVPDGIGTLTNGVGGLRYSVTSGLLDLKALLGSDGLFCGTGGSSGNFNAIKALLAQYLQSWNAANGAGNQADRVLGVVDAAISKGSSAGCAEGMAAVNSPEAWIRAVPEAQGVPSQSGLVAALELGHTFGMVLEARDDPFSRFHSPNVYADPTRSNRSYNTRLRSVIVDDRTAMTFIGGANNNNTLLEQLDWAYLICRFGGATSAECPAPAVPIGSGAGVAAGPRFVISGTTDGTVAGTKVIESFFSTDQLPTPPDPQSDLRLVYRIGGSTIDIGVPTYAEDSAHDDDGPGNPSQHADRSLFSGAFEFETDATRIELWHGAPDSGLLLYASDRNAPPVLDALTLGGGSGAPENYTNDPDSDDLDPAISADGQWVAWSAVDLPDEGGQLVLRVASVDDATNAWPLVIDDQETSSFEPAWCADGTQLAYVNDEGDLYRIDVDTSDGVSFGTPFVLHDADGVPPFAHDPTWSPDCSQLAYELDGDIWRIDADASNAVALTDNGRSFDPSWSPDPEDDRIAYAEEIDPGSFALLGADSSKLASPLSGGIILASFIEPDGRRLAPASHGGNHFVVNSADDVSDGTCDAAHCSLREAISAANTSVNLVAPDEILFNIAPAGAHTISPTSALPAITDPLIIDGTTQPGWAAGTPVVEIAGTDAGTADGLTVTAGGSTIRGLVINRFAGGSAILLAGAAGTTVESSFIGTNIDGDALATNGTGIFIDDSSDNVVGSTVAASRNVISGNGAGIAIIGAAATRNQVVNNYLGVGVDGLTDVGNGTGVAVSAPQNLIGLVGSPNIISGNATGILIAGSNADENVVQGNRIGTDATGTTAVSNSERGISLGSADNLVGGSGPGEGNLISGNATGTIANVAGISIGGAAATGNRILGNVIGLDVTGMVGLGNNRGIEINGAPGNLIGGANPGEGNLISGNSFGVQVVNAGTAGNVVEGNKFGVDVVGSEVIPNSLAIHAGASIDVAIRNNLVQGNLQGIQLSGGATGTVVTGNSILGSTAGILVGVATNTTIGGTGGLANTITGSSADGIAILGSTAAGIDIEGNSIYANGGLGIDLGDDGVTLNDIGDADSGANGLQNYPIVDSVVRDTGSTIVTGSLNSQPSTTYRLDFFASSACDPAGNGEGEVFLGSTSLVTDAGGNVAFTTTPLAPSNDGDVITSTATDPAGNTSEFSACDSLDVASFVVNTTDDTDDGLCGTLHCSLREAITRANTVAGTDTISFDIGAGGAQTIAVASALPTITDPVMVDGTTQPGYASAPIVEVDGAAAGAGVDGFTVGIGGNGSTIRGLAVNRFTRDGIRIFADDVVIESSYVGIGLDGTTDRGNGAIGIQVIGASGTRIGTGADVGAGNVISGNGQHGISVNGGSPTVPLIGTVIGGNLIGTDATGTAAVGNSAYGVFLNATTEDALVGGPTAAQRNVISGNSLGFVSAAGASGNTVEGNYIGTDVTGGAAIPNSVGVILTSSDSETIRDNVISGNTEDGVRLVGNAESEESAFGNTIIGNLIGTDASGTVDLGNGDDGVDLQDAADGNVIGGDTTETPGVENVVSGNGGNGINLGSSFGNVIQGNLIGTDVGGTLSIGNDLAGVRITGPSQGNQVGAAHDGTAISGPGNTIAFNAGNGVELVASGAADADFNSILSNAIHDNGGLGIDLEADGVTPNDPLDADDGSNDLKNFPDVVSGTSDGFSTMGTIGSDNSAPSEIIVYQLYANDDCDPSGNGEGDRLLATLETTADESGSARENFVIEEDLTGQWLTATTVDNQGQTSEFSACALVDVGGLDREIRLLNASLPLEPTELLVADGDEPFWASDGVLYSDAGHINRIQPTGSGDEAITGDEVDDAHPAAGLGVIGFVRLVEDAEVFLIRASGAVSVTASDKIPADLRLDLYYSCGGEILPIAVGITPNQTSATTASFRVNFDPSLSCADGEILAALSDGFLRSTTPPGSGETVASEDKPPVAATYGPPLGDTYLTSAVIPFHGAGEDAEDGTLDGSSLSWFIRASGDPCCGTAAGSGASVDFDASQLAPGDYIVTLIATDANGQTDVAESLIHILADGDHDGFSDIDESTTCFGAGAATDGSTPSRDADGDGIPNGSDPEPCVALALFTATMDIDPNELNLTSDGNPITATITVPGRNVSQIAGSSVRITAVGSQPVTFDNIGWTVKRGVATAKFSRQTLVDFLSAHGIENVSVSITVTGSSTTNPAWSFEGTDSTFVKR